MTGWAIYFIFWPFRRTVGITRLYIGRVICDSCRFREGIKAKNGIVITHIISSKLMLRTRFHPTTLHFLYYPTEQHIFIHVQELESGVVTTPFKSLSSLVTSPQNSYSVLVFIQPLFISYTTLQNSTYSHMRGSLGLVWSRHHSLK